jgi:hypothetical protein
MAKHRVQFLVEMDLAKGQNAEGWADSVLQAVEAIAPKKEGRVIGGVDVRRLCANGKHRPHDAKQATFTSCGECGLVDESSGP